jgi:hypothetical protein
MDPDPMAEDLPSSATIYYVFAEGAMFELVQCQSGGNYYLLGSRTCSILRQPDPLR